MLIKGAALQCSAAGALFRGERLVQPLGAHLRGSILVHIPHPHTLCIMGHQHQVQSYEGKNRGASMVRGHAPTTEDGCVGLVGHWGSLLWAMAT